MGDVADYYNDVGMDALIAHNRGECEYGCEYCEAPGDRMVKDFDGEDEFPDEYIPEQLRSVEKKPTQIIYACGYLRDNKGKDCLYQDAMFSGPFPTLLEALNVIPDDPDHKPRVIRFNLDGTEDVIYRWKKGRWKKIMK